MANAIQTTGSTNLAKISPANAVGLAIAPAVLYFSKAFFGTSATPQTVTLLAAGSQPLNIASITASGDFTETNNCGAVLAAGSTCAVNTVFTPTAEGSRNGTLTITSNAGGPRSVNMTGFGLLPSLNGAALNGASFSGANAAGSLASIFGMDLAVDIITVGDLPLPTEILDATVTVTGSSGTYPAAILYVSPAQINFQIPWEVAASSQVTLKVDSVSIPLALSRTAPAIFALNSQGTGPGAILISNTDQFAQPDGTVPSRVSQPVSRGQFISIYATGLGALTTAPPPDGTAPASQTTIAATATVSIGGATVTPSFAGLAPGFVGLYQVDAQVPASLTPGSAVPVFMTVDGVASNTVTIAVQ